MNSELPIIKQASIVLHPCVGPSLNEAGNKIHRKDVTGFLNERYAGWETRSATFLQDQLGMEIMLNLPPVEYFKLGMLFALVEEGKI